MKSKTPRMDEIAQKWARKEITTAQMREECDKIEAELADARAEIERLREYTTCTLETADNELDDKDLALIKKDKLIEQMREALELMLEGAMHDFRYVCQYRDNCLCWGCQKARIKAALAAERGGK